MDICISCSKEFERTSRSRKCRQCNNKYQKEWYAKNKQHRKDQLRQYDEQALHRNREWIYSYLQTHPCVDCGENDPVVLEFDHQGDKDESIGVAKYKWGLDRLIREVEKCDVRCANCHRRKTAMDFGHWKFRSTNTLD